MTRTSFLRELLAGSHGELKGGDEVEDTGGEEHLPGQLALPVLQVSHQGGAQVSHSPLCGFPQRGVWDMGHFRQGTCLGPGEKGSKGCFHSSLLPVPPCFLYDKKDIYKYI